MLKVCNVISDKNIGGAGKCILTFLKYYSTDKIDLTIIIPKDSLLKPKIEELGGKYIEIDGLADKSFDLSSIGKLRKIFKQIKPDIIHTHAAMSAKIAGKLYGKAKIIYTRHSVFQPSKFISRGLGKKINGFINNYLADRIIAVAQAAKDNLTCTGIKNSKIIVIKNGVEPLYKYNDSERETARLTYGITKDDVLMGIAARLTEVKGHIYILEALRKLIDDGLNVKLIIAGKGEYEQKIKDKINQLNLDKYVIMAGFIDDVEKFMNIIDINVNASFGTEATSLSLLEGLSVGVPSVVSDFGGNPGVVYDGINGLIFETKNSDMMYQKIKSILFDKQYFEKLQKGAYEVYNKEFRAEIMTEKTENVYFEITGGKCNEKK